MGGDGIKEVKCPVCGKAYYVKVIIFPTKMDDDPWDSYYCCPYCESEDSVVPIRLRGNEDVVTYKID